MKSFEFYDQGKIEGLKNIEKFEEKTEPWIDSEKDFYYVNAIKKDGTRKQIDNLEYVNMNDVSTNKVTFKSQDGEKTYSIYADEENYIQAFGWAGASNNVYYINDNCLYHKSLVDGTETKLVTGVGSIYTDEDGNIVVKLKFESFIHSYDQYIKFEQYNVTDSKIIDQKEDDNFIVCLKEDGSITVELKKGSKDRIGTIEYFKENYIYNFYVGDYSVHVYNKYSNYDSRKQGSNYYSNATAIYLDEIGTTGQTYFAFATKDKELITINIYEYVKNTIDGSFEGETGLDYHIISRGKHDKLIDELNPIDLKVNLEDGSTKDCIAIDVTYVEGRNTVVPVSPILDKEGYTGYTIVEE